MHDKNQRHNTKAETGDKDDPLVQRDASFL